MAKAEKPETMKVKLLAGLAFERKSFAPGDVIDLPVAEARRMIEKLQAEPVKPERRTAAKDPRKTAATRAVTA